MLGVASVVVIGMSEVGVAAVENARVVAAEQELQWHGSDEKRYMMSGEETEEEEEEEEHRKKMTKQPAGKRKTRER